MKLWHLIIGVVAIWAGTPFVITQSSLTDWATRGQFGDAFGSVTPLFSGLAFAGLFWALRLQSEQLELQRKELTLQREEMQASRRELANQAAAQNALFRASAAQVAVAAAQAELAALEWDAHQLNENFGARARLAKPARDIAAQLKAMHRELIDSVDTGGARDGGD